MKAVHNLCQNLLSELMLRMDKQTNNQTKQQYPHLDRHTDTDIQKERRRGNTQTKHILVEKYN